MALSELTEPIPWGVFVFQLSMLACFQANSTACVLRKRENRAADKKNYFSDNPLGPPETAVGLPVATS